MNLRIRIIQPVYRDTTDIYMFRYEDRQKYIAQPSTLEFVEAKEAARFDDVQPWLSLDNESASGFLLTLTDAIQSLGIGHKVDNTAEIKRLEEQIIDLKCQNAGQMKLIGDSMLRPYNN